MKQISLIILSLLLASPVFAGKGEGYGHKGQGKNLFKQLGLSKEQKTELKKIRLSRKSKMKSLRNKKKEARKEYKAAMIANASDSSLRSLHNKMLDSSNAFKKYKFRTMLKTRALLTDSQRENFNKLRAESHKKKKNKD